MDVELPGLDGHVDAMAKRARAIAARRGVGVHVIAPRTRRPADLILREARRRKAQLIVLGATGRSRTSHRALARDAVTRRISDQASVPTMFIQAPVAA
jgi:nucleotide-binding universal stress UspA family protein